MARNFEKENAYMNKIFKQIPKTKKSEQKEIESFVRNSVLPDASFIFRHREKDGTYYGYCDRCGKEMQFTNKRTTAYKDINCAFASHNEWVHCPNCGKNVQIKNSGMGRGKMYFYGKLIVPVEMAGGLMLRYFDCVRDYTAGGDYTTVKTKYTEEYRTFFEAGKVTTWQNKRYYSCELMQWATKWEKMSKIKTDYSTKSSSNYYFNVPSKPALLFNYSKLRKTLKNIDCFKYFRIAYDPQYLEYASAPTVIRCLERIVKYPVLEYFEKSGFNWLAEFLENNYTVTGLNLNLKGKTPEKVFKMTKSEIGRLKQMSSTLNAHSFEILQKIRKISDYFVSTKELETLYETGDFYLDNAIDQIAKNLGHFGHKETKFLCTIVNQEIFALSTYCDYLNYAKKSGLNLGDERVLLNLNFKKAHDEFIELERCKRAEAAAARAAEKEKENKELNKKIKKRFAALNKKFYFEAGEFLIRPAKSMGEIVVEGVTQNICVGSLSMNYIKNHANGKNFILFIRKVDKPDMPFYTVEVTPKGKILQNRGFQNCGTTPEIDAFIEQWEHRNALPVRKSA